MRVWSIGVALCAAACASTPHTPVDLELDVDAASPDDAAYVRLCDEGGMAQQYGATRRGTYVLTGVWADDAPRVTVDVLDVDEQLIGRAGPVELVLDYQLTALDTAPCADDPDCAPCTGCILQDIPTVTWDDDLPLCQPGQVPERDASGSVGVRFRDPDAP